MSVNEENYLTASWDWGSRVLVTFDWGDQTPPVANSHFTDERDSNSSHVYREPGTFYPKINIHNYLLDCSNQTLHLLPPLIVDYLIEGFVIVGAPIALLTHPNYNRQTHSVTLKFQLCAQQGINTPIYLKMRIDYGDGGESIAAYICNSANIGNQPNFCPFNYTFCAFTPEHDYYITGDVVVKAYLWNTLNSVNIEFSHTIYSEIKDIKNFLYVLPYGYELSDVLEELLRLWESPYYPLENTILFASNMTYGSETNLTYWWNFGDNSAEITPVCFARHKYQLPGEYVITLNVSNPLSTSTITEVINYVSPSNAFRIQTGKIIAQR